MWNHGHIVLTMRQGPAVGGSSVYDFLNMDKPPQNASEAFAAGIAIVKRFPTGIYEAGLKATVEYEGELAATAASAGYLGAFRSGQIAGVAIASTLVSIVSYCALHRMGVVR